MAKKTTTQQQRAIILIVLSGFLLLSIKQIHWTPAAPPPVSTSELQQQITAHPLIYLQTININTATAIELTGIPGIGPVLANRIIDFRTANGPFKDISELKQVQGIGEKTLLRLHQYLHI